MHISVSPEGAVLVPGTEQFFDRIGYSNPDFDAGDYVVRNMGFVSIQRRSSQRLLMRMRPKLVRPAGLDGVLRFLVDQRFDYLEIQYLADGGDWLSEIWPNDPATLHRIVDLCDDAELDEPTYAIAPLDVTDLGADTSNPLKPLFQKWRVSSSEFDDTTLPFLMSYGLDYRLSIMAASSDSEPLRFAFIGQGFKFFDEKQRMSAIGSRIDQQPDKAYGSWLAEQYRHVVVTRKPSLDYVTAIIRSTQTGEWRRSRYERLLLPWKAHNGELMVTCASVVLSIELHDGSLEAETESRRSAVG